MKRCKIKDLTIGTIFVKPKGVILRYDIVTDGTPYIRGRFDRKLRAYVCILRGRFPVKFLFSGNTEVYI